MKKKNEFTIKKQIAKTRYELEILNLDLEEIQSSEKNNKIGFKID